MKNMKSSNSDLGERERACLKWGRGADEWTASLTNYARRCMQHALHTDSHASSWLCYMAT